MIGADNKLLVFSSLNGIGPRQGGGRGKAWYSANSVVYSSRGMTQHWAAWETGVRLVLRGTTSQQSGTVSCFY